MRWLLLPIAVFPTLLTVHDARGLFSVGHVVNVVLISPHTWSMPAKQKRSTPFPFGLRDRFASPIDQVLVDEFGVPDRRVVTEEGEH
ncbi:hypothetical protein C4D60_Mb04t28110 [Musa balbisiana]|uniref:Uncharacterized protein n=1 Tax=Musa balbisiana TaxID=52838 RepID=A0A4S8KFB1_MUSBA|nr:hypothetical protein C4D60_Mb04t28110 [Musa balbisiana]